MEFCSVFIAFSIGALVQFISRTLLSYNYEQKSKWVGSVFGGVALTSISYFILMKGIKGTSAKESFDVLDGSTISSFLETEVLMISIVSFILLSLISYLLIFLLRVNIYKLIIGVGTFSLALAFAGNDLVNLLVFLLPPGNHMKPDSFRCSCRHVFNGSSFN